MSTATCTRCGSKTPPRFAICPTCGHDTSLSAGDASNKPLLGQRYRRLEALGMGGMGAVYEAEDLKRGERVALKMLINYDASSLARLRREARAMAQFEHPNATRLLDMHVDEGVNEPYIVMELVPGRTLHDVFKDEHRFTPERTRRILTQLLDALSAAHEAEVVHRDLTPRNIIIDEKNEDHVKVLDFGIAKVLDATELTRTGSLLGTLGYMAPEQIRSQPVGPWTDLYSVGVLLYRMLTGNLPFDSARRAAVLYQQAYTTPIPPRQVRDDIDAGLDSLCMKAMSLDPAARPASAREMLEALAGKP